MTTAREQTNELASMLQRERGGLVDFLLAFSDFHARKRWRELEYASGFAYLRGELKLSEGAAYNRIVAAELIHGVPEVAAALLSGALCFSTVTQVAKVVTPENKDELLPRFFRLSRGQAEQLAVSLRPVAVIPVREVVNAIRPPPAATRAAAALPAPAEATGASPAAGAETFRFPLGEVAAGMDGGPPGAQLHQVKSPLPFGCEPPPEPPRDEIAEQRRRRGRSRPTGELSRCAPGGPRLACSAPVTRFSCADRAAPVPALGTGPRTASRLEPARRRSPGANGDRSRPAAGLVMNDQFAIA
jgi:hypothetical protein